MADIFETANTIATPAADIVRILILQARNNALDAIERYDLQEDAGYSSNSAIINARIKRFYREIQPMIKKKLNKKEYDELKANVFSTDLPKLIAAFDTLNDMLYKLQLIRIDTRPDYDPRDTEAENRYSGIS